MGRTDIPISHHFTCAGNVTSFYERLTPNLSITSIIYPGMCVPSFVLLHTPSRCGDIARKKMGENMSPQRLAGGAEAQRPPG